MLSKTQEIETRGSRIEGVQRQGKARRNTRLQGWRMLSRAVEPCTKAKSKMRPVNEEMEITGKITK